MITVGLIIGSMRENRESIGILNWIIEKLTIHEEVEPKILDLKNYSLPFFGEDTNKDMVKKWRVDVRECDAFIFLAPEFNHSIAGSLKNALDLLDWELHHKPAAIISYGFSGNGVRAAEHLKLICSAYSMLIISPQLSFSLIDEMKNGLFNPRDWHSVAAKLMIEEMLKWTYYSWDYLKDYSIKGYKEPLNNNNEWNTWIFPGLKSFCNPIKIKKE